MAPLAVPAPGHRLSRAPAARSSRTAHPWSPQQPVYSGAEREDLFSIQVGFPLGLNYRESEARQYRVHITDIAHPDVDGVAGSLFHTVRGSIEVDEFLTKAGPGAYTAEALAEERLYQASHRQEGGTPPSKEVGQSKERK
jgi:hypothetical protein